ncbi:FHA domain-containing protein [Planctomycetota bacterium]
MIRLTIRCRGAEEEVTFTDEEIVTIGRSAKNNLQIPDNRASRKHCLIEKAEQGYRVVDLGSRNGTQLNGKKISAQALQKGDRIVTGEATIIVNEIGAGRPVETAPAAAPAAGVKPAVPAVAARTRVGAGGITIRRGPREMPPGLLDYVLWLIILLLAAYIAGVVWMVASKKGLTEEIKEKGKDLFQTESAED